MKITFNLIMKCTFLFVLLFIECQTGIVLKNFKSRRTIMAELEKETAEAKPLLESKVTYVVDILSSRTKGSQANEQISPRMKNETKSSKTSKTKGGMQFKSAVSEVMNKTEEDKKELKQSSKAQIPTKPKNIAKAEVKNQTKPLKTQNPIVSKVKNQTIEDDLDQEVEINQKVNKTVSSKHQNGMKPKITELLEINATKTVNQSFIKISNSSITSFVHVNVTNLEPNETETMRVNITSVKSNGTDVIHLNITMAVQPNVTDVIHLNVTTAVKSNGTKIEKSNISEVVKSSIVQVEHLNVSKIVKQNSTEVIHLNVTKNEKSNNTETVHLNITMAIRPNTTELSQPIVSEVVHLNITLAVKPNASEILNLNITEDLTRNKTEVLKIKDSSDSTVIKVSNTDKVEEKNTNSKKENSTQSNIKNLENSQKKEKTLQSITNSTNSTNGQENATDSDMVKMKLNELEQLSGRMKGRDKLEKSTSDKIENPRLVQLFTRPSEEKIDLNVNESKHSLENPKDSGSKNPGENLNVSAEPTFNFTFPISLPLEAMSNSTIFQSIINLTKIILSDEINPESVSTDEPIADSLNKSSNDSILVKETDTLENKRNITKEQETLKQDDEKLSENKNESKFSDSPKEDNNKEMDPETVTMILLPEESNETQSASGLDFLVNSEVTKNAVLAMDVFNLSDTSLADHVIEDSDIHSFIDLMMPAVPNSIVQDVPNPKSSNETESEPTNSSSEKTTETKSEFQLNTTTSIDDKRTESSVEFETETSSVSQLQDTETEITNATEIIEVFRCPPPSLCLFWFASRDTCSHDTECPGTKLCCKVRCSKHCIDVKPQHD